ncbi:hypothetical protein C8Q74DRAFT_997991 [Fomes fomentarius]|nr:hypothetical protein C8Q74DRAFT_997991 [Fomes fomentarius]
MSIMTATAPAPATAAAPPHFYRPHHPFASSHGDASYALMLPERSRRAEGHARKPSELAPFRDTQHSTSHFHPHSEPQVPASAPAPASSPPSYCPRVEVRASSLSQLCHPSPTPSLRASMSFAHTNATLTWGSSSAWSPSSSFASAPPSSPSASPSTSRVRHHEERRRHLVHTEADGDVSEMNDERSAGEEPLAIARRGALISPIRPSQTLRPLSLSPDNSNTHGSSSSSSLDGLWYSSRQDSWSPESRRPTLPSFTQLQLPNPTRSVYPEFIQGSSRPGSRPTSSGLYRGSTVSPPQAPVPAQAPSAPVRLRATATTRIPRTRTSTCTSSENPRASSSRLSSSRNG